MTRRSVLVLALITCLAVLFAVVSPVLGGRNARPGHWAGGLRTGVPSIRAFIPSTLFTAVLRFDGAHAVISQTLGGFQYHQQLHVTGGDGSIRSWWSGTMDHTLHPTFELQAQAREAMTAFAQRRVLVSGEDARKRIVVCLAAEQSPREQREIAPRF